MAHASFRASSGKVEGMNNKIKTIRRQGYGYSDDDYFFLKIFDASRETYVRNPKSHKIQDWATISSEKDIVSGNNIIHVIPAWKYLLKQLFPKLEDLTESKV